MSDAALTWQKRKSLTSFKTRRVVFFVVIFSMGLIYSLERGVSGVLIRFLREERFPFNEILVEGMPGISAPQLIQHDAEEQKIVSRAIFLPALGPTCLGWVCDIQMPQQACASVGGVNDGTQNSKLPASEQEVFTKAVTAHSTTSAKPTACMDGLDSASDLSLEALTMRTTTPYQFVGRYLGGPCYPGKPLSVSEASILSHVGFWLNSIYSGANWTDSVHGGIQTYAQGQKDGEQAVLLARGVKQPIKSAIYLDLEAGQLHQNDYIAYVKGWVCAVRAGGYRAGVYSSAAQLDTIQHESWAGTSILYWDAHWIYSGVQTPAPCPSKDLSYAQVWQYAKHVMVCEKYVDIDSVKSLDGMWKL